MLNSVLYDLKGASVLYVCRPNGFGNTLYIKRVHHSSRLPEFFFTVMASQGGE